MNGLSTLTVLFWKGPGPNKVEVLATGVSFRWVGFLQDCEKRDFEYENIGRSSENSRYEMNWSNRPTWDLVDIPGELYLIGHLEP